MFLKVESMDTQRSLFCCWCIYSGGITIINTVIKVITFIVAFLCRKYMELCLPGPLNWMVFNANLIDSKSSQFTHITSDIMCSVGGMFCGMRSVGGTFRNRGGFKMGRKLTSWHIFWITEKVPAVETQLKLVTIFPGSWKHFTQHDCSHDYS